MHEIRTERGTLKKLQDGLGAELATEIGKRGLGSNLASKRAICKASAFLLGANGEVPCIIGEMAERDSPPKMFRLVV